MQNILDFWILDVSWWTEYTFCSCLFCGFALPLLQQLSLKYLTRAIAFHPLSFQLGMGKDNLRFMEVCKVTLIPVFSVLHNEIYGSWKGFGMCYTISVFFPRIWYSVWTALFVVRGRFFVPLLLHTKAPIPQKLLQSLWWITLWTSAASKDSHMNKHARASHSSDILWARCWSPFDVSSQ